MLPSLTALLWSPTRRPERGAALREDLCHPPLDGVHGGLDQVGRRSLHRRVDRLPLRRRPRVRVGPRGDLGQVPPPTAQRLHISSSPTSVYVSNFHCILSDTVQLGSRLEAR